MKPDLTYTVHIDPDKVERVLASLALEGYYPIPDNNSYIAADDTFYIDLHNAVAAGLIHSFHCKVSEVW